MKKNLNRIIAFAIGVSVISGSTMPTFAADITQNASASTNIKNQENMKPVLTLDDSIKLAINSSEILALDEKKINYKDKINDVNEKIDDDPQLVGKLEIETSDDKKDLDKDTRDIELKQCKQQRDFDEDKLIQKVTTAYNDIVTNQMKIDKAKNDIELKNRELNITQLRSDIGSATSVDLDADSLKIEDLEDKLKSSENTLKDAQYSFKVLTGKDVTKYSLEEDIKYDVFKIDGSVDEHFDDAIENYLKYSTQIIKLDKDFFNDSDHKVPDVTDKPSDDKPVFNNDGDLKAYEEYETKMDNYYQERETYAYKLSIRLAYLNAKLGAYEGETNLDETKKQFKDQLRSFYTMLLTTEDTINFLKKNIMLYNKELKISKVKYDDGLITKIDYDTQVSNSEDLNIQLRSAIDRYNTLKEEIEKPWIAFSK
ncbi:TolC family protein [Clostridium sp.]|uniref:TolC family protein n=1 Tax=Clostridium sp. TaxID=1506 RepID=UPI00284EF04E|nr:TolC family protein [Clostridium sp.]MDR3596930.1 TolC family protein [Clostridium sp.]